METPTLSFDNSANSISYEWNGSLTLSLDKRKTYNIQEGYLENRKYTLIIEAKPSPVVSEQQPIKESKSLVQIMIEYLRLKSGVSTLRKI